MTKYLKSKNLRSPINLSLKKYLADIIKNCCIILKFNNETLSHEAIFN